ncbi:MAG: hypothetical protein OXB95_10740 [Rhodobacteraceae bacterium]|nr:hypothetical protein [Paracoccaceae bacterium]
MKDSKVDVRFPGYAVIQRTWLQARYPPPARIWSETADWAPETLRSDRSEPPTELARRQALPFGADAVRREGNLLQ